MVYNIIRDFCPSPGPSARSGKLSGHREARIRRLKPHGIRVSFVQVRFSPAAARSPGPGRNHRDRTSAAGRAKGMRASAKGGTSAPPPSERSAPPQWTGYSGRRAAHPDAGRVTRRGSRGTRELFLRVRHFTSDRRKPKTACANRSPGRGTVFFRVRPGIRFTFFIFSCKIRRKERLWQKSTEAKFG